MKVLALVFVLGLVSCTPKEAPVATEPAAVETTTTEEAPAATEEAATTEEAPAATETEAHNHAE